ncbi:MAG: hypothetical protein ACLVGL_14160 [Waltera sp.]
MRDKTLDDRFFILTLFGIGKELEKRTQPQKDTIYQVELPVGLPPKHYGALYEKFGQYFVRPVCSVLPLIKGSIWCRSRKRPFSLRTMLQQ